MAVTAGTLVTIIRDTIPDGVYDSSGTAQPTADGDLFRAQTLYRFLNDGVKSTAEKLGWTIVDWYAMAQTANQPFYSVDSKWTEVMEAFANQWQLQFLNEGTTIFPTLPVQKPLWWGKHKVTDHLELNLYPTPSTTDPSTKTTVAMSASGTTPIYLASTDNFATYGFALIESEIVQYYDLQSTAIGATGTITRGACGTTAAAHSGGAPVTYLGFWVKGPRMPLEIATATDTVELPNAFHFALQLYVLARCARAQNDDQVASNYMQEYNAEMQRLRNDPSWRAGRQGMQVIPYGTSTLGPLAWGRVVLP